VADDDGFDREPQDGPEADDEYDGYDEDDPDDEDAIEFVYDATLAPDDEAMAELLDRGEMEDRKGGHCLIGSGRPHSGRSTTA
jgi:hypothetical protein